MLRSAMQHSLQVKEYRRYVMREVMHHGGLKHPFIIDLKARRCCINEYA